MAIASLPMYDLLENRLDFDAFYHILAENLRQQGLENIPATLTRDQPVRELWADPDLLISQCCGYDVIARYKGQLRVVATPKFSAYGCVAENYCSLIVVPDDSPFKDVRDMVGTVAVINGPESHSGMSALRHLISQRHCSGRFFSEVKVSGSHVASLQMLQEHQADIAAIDSVSLSLLRYYRPDSLKNIKVLGTTYTAPAPPYVVHASMPEGDVAKVQAAILATFADPNSADLRKTLLLDGVTLSNQDDYWLLEAFRDHALKQGFPMVAPT